MKQVKRTERGWAGHFICADRCTFRRNTLLEFGQRKVVVSTVGGMRNEGKVEEIGINRFYETMSFEAFLDGKYWEADVSKELDFRDSVRFVGPDSDNLANSKHESVVDQVSAWLVAEHSQALTP